MTAPELGVIRDVLTFNADDATSTRKVVGHLFLRPADNEPIVGEVIMWTLGDDRLRAALHAVNEGADTPDGVLAALEAVALRTEAEAAVEADDDEDDEPDVWYDRDALLETLARHHQRPDGSCICDWSAPLSNDWAGHFVRVYETKVGR